MKIKDTVKKMEAAKKSIWDEMEKSKDNYPVYKALEERKNAITEMIEEVKTWEGLSGVELINKTIDFSKKFLPIPEKEKIPEHLN